MNGDRFLASLIYIHFRIPEADWPAHYSLDCTRTSKELRKSVRTVYEMIWRTLP